MKNEYFDQNSRLFRQLQHSIAILCWHERWISAKQILAILELCHDEETLHRFCQTRALYERFSDLSEASKRGLLLLDAYAQQGITILFSNDNDYPPQLRSVANAKPILSVSGRSDILKQAQVAIVGSRNLIHEAIAPTQKLAQHLINCGFILTSGGAIGIDAIAHRCAMQANQPSIIVTATSVDRTYPKENADIFDYCRLKGAIVSHSPIDTPPERRLFPSRNATIAGLSQATIVAQAGALSGALYTARASLTINRPVYVLSMPAFDEACLGGLQLVSEGKAKCLSQISDLDELRSPHDMPAKSRNLFEIVLPQAKSAKNSYPLDPPRWLESPQEQEKHCPVVSSVKTDPQNTIHQAILEKVQNARLTREMLRSLLSHISYDDFNHAILDLELNGHIVYTAGSFRLSY